MPFEWIIQCHCATDYSSYTFTGSVSLRRKVTIRSHSCFYFENRRFSENQRSLLTMIDFIEDDLPNIVRPRRNERIHSSSLVSRLRADCQHVTDKLWSTRSMLTYLGELSALHGIFARGDKHDFTHDSRSPSSLCLQLPRGLRKSDEQLKQQFPLSSQCFRVIQSENRLSSNNYIRETKRLTINRKTETNVRERQFCIWLSSFFFQCERYLRTLDIECLSWTNAKFRVTFFRSFYYALQSWGFEFVQKIRKKNS